MMPGAKKRKADFTDVVMYVAIATKHARLITLLITLALTGGLIFYIFSRPVYYSKSVITYTAIGTGNASSVRNASLTIQLDNPKRVTTLQQDFERKATQALRAVPGARIQFNGAMGDRFQITLVGDNTDVGGLLDALDPARFAVRAQRRLQQVRCRVIAADARSSRADVGKRPPAARPAPPARRPSP